MNYYDIATNLLIPADVKAGKLYALKPTSGVGDFTFARGFGKNVIGEYGLLHYVADDIAGIHFPVLGGCQTLLLEPERTNLLPYPVSFDDSSWIRTNVTPVSGQTSPHADYPNGAFKLVDDAIEALHYIHTVVTLTTGEDYIYSLRVKKGERKYFQFLIVDGSTKRVIFDLENGTVDLEVDAIANIYDDLANDYYTCSMKITASTTGAKQFRTYILNDAKETNYLGDGVSGIYIFGAQFEQGSYMTSFIYDGNEGAAVTRIRDNCRYATYTGLSDSGVFMFDVRALYNDGTTRMISITDGGNSNAINFKYDSTTNRITVEVLVAGAPQAQMAIDTYTVTDFHKIAIRWAVDDFSLWVGTDKVRTDNSGSVPTGLNTINFANGVGGSNFFYGMLSEMICSNYLSDEDMENLMS